MTTPDDEISITITHERTAINVFTISDVLLNSKEGFLRSKLSLKNSQIPRKTTQITHSAISGMNVNTPAIIPNAPTPDFSSFKQSLTVENASLTAPPTIGMQVSIIIFAPDIARLSAELPTIFWSVKTLTNSAETNFTVDLINLYEAQQNFSRFICVETDDITEIPNKKFIKGIKKYAENLDIIWPEKSTKHS